MIHVADIRWGRPDLPAGLARPALAVPLVNRREVTGIAFYGRHESGEDLDPDEVASIEELCRAAAVAYDELEAETLRLRARDLEQTVTVLEARLEERRRLNSPGP